MKVQAYPDFVCPLDGLPLEVIADGAQCSAGHHFDRAREGYLNLLPVQHKASRQPGDDQAMVAARRRVLDSGVFALLADAVFEIVGAMVSPSAESRPLRVVDAGCGEGYYLARLINAARACGGRGALSLAGFDISKFAVRAAARRSDAVAWAVASNRQPPFPLASIDVILSLFGFPQWEAFEGVLARGGCVLLVEAGADHLLELRELIYPQVERHHPPLPHAAMARGWRVRHERTIQYRVDLNTPAEIAALLVMTPHAHRATHQGRAALASLPNLSTTVSAVLRVMESPTLTPAGKS